VPAGSQSVETSEKAGEQRKSVRAPSLPRPQASFAPVCFIRFSHYLQATLDFQPFEGVWFHPPEGTRAHKTAGDRAFEQEDLNPESKQTQLQMLCALKLRKQPC